MSDAARTIRAQEALGDGDVELAEGILIDLSLELEALQPHPYSCPRCSFRARFPGEMETHLVGRHSMGWDDIDQVLKAA